MSKRKTRGKPVTFRRKDGKNIPIFPRALTKAEKINLGTTEIAKRIRHQLKQELPNCTFSVTRQYYSMGSSVTVALMKADRRVIAMFKDLSEFAVLRYTQQGIRTKAQLKQMQEGNYFQLSEPSLRRPYNPDVWYNGVFLTKAGHTLLQRVVRISDHYNFDDSDIQTDYSSRNFSFNLSLGKWNKPFVDGPRIVQITKNGKRIHPGL